MILRKIKLNPFAGLYNKEIEFNNGLNIVFGPNEAGKSTIINSIREVLFKPVKLTQKKLSQMRSYFPIAGGDSISVSLDFDLSDGICSLTKNWGAGAYVKLELPDKTIYVSDEEVDRILGKLIPLNQGTYENILIVSQLRLTDTIESIKNSKETEQSIECILRNAVFTTGGISVSLLKKLLENKVKVYFARWDAGSNSPEKKVRWLKGTGIIVEQFYELEELKQQLNEVLKFENNIDALNSKIKILKNEVIELNEFVNKNIEAYKGARERRNLNLQKENLLSGQSKLIEIQKEWPRFDGKREFLEREQKKLEQQLETLDKEMIKSEEYEKHKIILNKYEKARSLNNELLKAKDLQIIELTQRNLDDAQRIFNLINEYKIKLEAQKLKIKILAKLDSEVKLTILEDEQFLILQQNEEKDFEIPGKFILDTNELKLSVCSGNEDIDSIIENIKDNEIELKNILDKFSSKDIPELKLKFNDYQKHLSDIKSINDKLETILEGEKFETLTLKAEKNIDEQRSVKDINKDKIESNQNHSLNKKEIDDIKIKIDKWEKEYGSEDKIISIIAANLNAIAELEKLLNNLKSLPEGFENEDGFIKHYENLEKEFNNKNSELENLRTRKETLEESNKFEYDTKELSELIEDAKIKFQNAKKTGERYLIIQQELNKILDQIDKNSFDPLKKEISGILSELTMGKYPDILLKEILPSAIRTTDQNLPVELLSAGTKDILALSIRLAMAKFYLKEKDGFIIMDDPLINLDDKRKLQAIKVIKKIAEDKQVIIFTCHQNHAELFEEEIMQIGS